MYTDPNATAPTSAAATTAGPGAAAPAFVVGHGFDPDATQAIPALQAQTPLPAPGAPQRRGRRALVAVGLLTAAALGAFGAVAVGSATGTAIATGARSEHIGSDLAGALPQDRTVGESASGEVVTETTTAPTASSSPQTTQPAPPPTTAPVTPPTAPPTTAPPAPPSTDPAVAALDGPAQVVCNSGGTPYITLQWSVQHADAVVLSIDGPGAYKNYPGTNGSDSVPFPCDGNTHSYTITAKAAGKPSDSTTLTISPVSINLPNGQVTIPMP